MILYTHATRQCYKYIYDKCVCIACIYVCMDCVVLALHQGVRCPEAGYNRQHQHDLIPYNACTCDTMVWYGLATQWTQWTQWYGLATQWYVPIHDVCLCLYALCCTHTPPLSALPRTRMSGLTPSQSLANIRPVRHRPVWTCKPLHMKDDRKNQLTKSHDLITLPVQLYDTGLSGPANH